MPSGSFASNHSRFFGPSRSYRASVRRASKPTIWPSEHPARLLEAAAKSDSAGLDAIDSVTSRGSVKPSSVGGESTPSGAQGHSPTRTDVESGAGDSVTGGVEFRVHPARSADARTMVAEARWRRTHSTLSRTRDAH